ncbi:hypothetical protein KKF32_01565 [Patescibacteria group bacterium]|nr:hypothetical protein [Patescibacteria group bacterium]
MKKVKFIAPLALLVLVITVGTVFAAQTVTIGDSPNVNLRNFKERPKFDSEKFAEMQEKFAAVQETIKNSDYDIWAELMADSPITEYINKDNFAKFVEMHNLMDQAKQIGEELGIEKMAGHRGMMKGFRFNQPPVLENQQ